LDSVDNPLKNLDVSIHSLRKALEPERKSKESSFILFSDSCYAFNWSCSHSLDISLFEQYYQDWQKENSEENAEKVLSLYQGELLPEIDFAENWQEERASFQRKAISLLTWLTESKIKNKNYSQAEYSAEKLISLDNLNEDSHFLLMRVATEKRDKTLLNQIYRDLENLLKKELDCQPSMETQKQYARMLEKILEEK